MVVLNLEGEIGGSMVLTFNEENGRQLAASLLQTEPTPGPDWNELEQSALTETGNILGCAYVNAITRLIDHELMPSPPYFVQDYGASVVEQALVAQAGARDHGADLPHLLPQRRRGVELVAVVRSLRCPAHGDGKRLAEARINSDAPHLVLWCSMLCVPSIQAPIDVAVGMGQAVLAAEPSRLTTILGSCVAVTLYSPARRLGILGHVVLPRSRSAVDHPAKYADTAIPHMLMLLQREGIEPWELTAKFAGGACMFGNGQFSQIGESNVQAAMQHWSRRASALPAATPAGPPAAAFVSISPPASSPWRPWGDPHEPSEQGNHYYGKDSACHRRRRDRSREDQGSGPWRRLGNRRRSPQRKRSRRALR